MKEKTIKLNSRTRVGTLNSQTDRHCLGVYFFIRLKSFVRASKWSKKRMKLNNEKYLTTNN
jgi:hypothetical protein